MMMDIIRYLQKIRNKLLSGEKSNGDDSVSCFDYRDQLSELIFSEQGIILGNNLEDYLNAKHDPYQSFAGVVSADAGTYQREFASLLHTLFYDTDKVNVMLGEYEIDKPVVKRVELCISRLYEAYKDYLVNLVEFYIVNPEFKFPLGCYPQSLLNEPFYEYIKSDLTLKHYNEETRTRLYLQLIEKIIFSRFLDLNKDAKHIIKVALARFTENKNKEIARVANRIKNKLSHYKGVKCPDHLIYISLLSEKEADRLVEFTLSRYFEQGTSPRALKLAYMGMLRIIPEDNEALAKYYCQNPYYSKPLIIQYKKRGYVSFIFDYLETRNYISHDNKWDSIARHQYFKTRKIDGRAEFLTSNELSQSLGYKRQRVNAIHNKTQDKELEQLDLFLKDNFKSR